MKKEVRSGDVVVYRDKETKEVCATIITYVTGSQRHQYYRVAMNSLGMIMDYIDPQLKIEGLNSSLKGSFSSLQEIMSSKNETVREEALYALLYYVQNTSKSDERLFDLLIDNDFTKESISKYFINTNKENQSLLIDNGIMNLMSIEDNIAFLNDVKCENLLCNFINAKNDRKYFFDDNRTLIKDKINTIITDITLKNKCLNKLLSLSWNTIVENPEYIDYIVENFKDFDNADKGMFLYRLNTTLTNINRSETQDKDIILKNIVKELSNCQGFVDFVSDNIEEYFSTLSGDNDYELEFVQESENGLLLT